MRHLLGILVLLALVGCSQVIHVKTTERISKAVIDGKAITDVSPEGREAIVPVQFGPALYNLYDNNRLVGNGIIARSQINPWSYGLSVGGAMVLAPALAIAGALVVNPSWVYSSSVFLNGGGTGSFWAYLAQTASFFTFPSATLGALIGLLPLVGLLYSERLPDIVVLKSQILRSKDED